jgi:hypothetical protein
MKTTRCTEGGETITSLAITAATFSLGRRGMTSWRAATATIIFMVATAMTRSMAVMIASRP